MEQQRTIVLVLRSGGDFSFVDVELIARHINGNWKSSVKPRIICFWDKATVFYNLGNLEVQPYPVLPGLYSKLTIFSPLLEPIRPFLYMDLDTAVVGSVEDIIDSIPDYTKFIIFGGFYQAGRLATALVWIPQNSEKVKKVWDHWDSSFMAYHKRMDIYICSMVTADLYWQQITNKVVDFKPKHGVYVTEVSKEASLVCFHGKPRILDAINIPWVNEYIRKQYEYERVE